MSLRTTLGLSSSLDEGTPDEVVEKKRPAVTEVLRPKRLEAAGASQSGPRSRTASFRGGGVGLSASTDAIYQPVRGVVFQPYSVNLVAADRSELAFYIDADGELVFLERVPGTWKEHVERRERRRLSRARA